MGAKKTYRPRSRKWKDHYNRWKVARYRERQQLLALLKSSPCMDCHKKYPPYVMDFDHVRGKKEYHVANMACSGISLQRVLEEIAKCDVVCANCHRVRTHIRSVVEAIREDLE